MAIAVLKNRVLEDINCNHCPANFLCLPEGLVSSEIEKLNTLISNVKILKKKEHVFNIHSPMQNLYAVYQGSCKEYWIDKNGNECVTNFYFPGDLIGLESMPDRKHRFSVLALEQSQLCVIPIEPLFTLMQDHSAIMKRFIHITSLKMQNDQSVQMGVTAEERVCDFLLNIISRMQERNPEKKEISLPMSQLDISNYLGIAHETVNRIFQDLKLKQYIKMKNKTLYVLDMDKLGNSSRR